MMMSRILALLLVWLTAIAPAWSADNTVVLTPGAGVTLRSKDVGSGVESLMQILGDTSGNPLATAPGTPNAVFALPIQGVTGGTALPVTVTQGGNTAAVKAASTPAALTDPSLVVQNAQEHTDLTQLHTDLTGPIPTQGTPNSIIGAAQSALSGVTNLQTAAAANGNGTDLELEGYAGAVLHVVCSVACSGGTTVNFEASFDGSSYVAIQGTPVGGGTAVATAITTGDFAFNVAGYSDLRARISAYSAGTITVTGFTSSQSSLQPGALGAITAASGAYAAGALAAGSGVDGWNLTEGAKTDAACAGDTTSGCSIEQRLQRIAQNLSTVNTSVGNSVPAGSNVIGGVNFPVNVTATACSGTITSGGTAQNAFTAQSTLHGFSVANIDTTEPLWVSFTTTAAASGADSYPLPAATATTFAGFGSFTSPPGFALNHAVSVIAATTSHKFSCTWW